MKALMHLKDYRRLLLYSITGYIIVCMGHTMTTYKINYQNVNNGNNIKTRNGTQFIDK